MIPKARARVTSIAVEIDGVRYELSLADACALRDDLNGALGTPGISHIPPGQMGLVSHVRYEDLRRELSTRERGG